MYKYYKLKRFFDAEKDNGGTPKQGDDGGNQSDSTPKTKLDTAPTITVAQAEENAKKAADEALTKLLADLGIDNVDTLSTTVQQARDAEEAGKTELQKLTDQITSLTEELINKETALSQSSDAITALTIDNAIIQEAGGYGFHNVTDDVLPKAREMLSIDEDGQVKDVAKVLDSIKEKYPHYVANATTGTQTKGEITTPKTQSIMEFKDMKVPRI